MATIIFDNWKIYWGYAMLILGYSMVVAFIAGLIFRYAHWGVASGKRKITVIALGCFFYIFVNSPLFFIYLDSRDPFPFFFFAVSLPILFVAGYFPKTPRFNIIFFSTLLPTIIILLYILTDTAERKQKWLHRYYGIGVENNLRK